MKRFSSAAIPALLALTILAHGLYAALGSTMAVDLWMAMGVGRYIVGRWTLPRADVFSYTYAGVPWFNGEWLAQAGLFLLYSAGGGTALVALKLGVVATCFLLVAWIGWRRGGSLALSAATAIAAAFICRRFFDIRPELALYLGTLTVMAIVETYRRGSRFTVLALPPLFAVWVNLHFSFIYGLGVLGLLAAGEAGKSWLGLAGALPARRTRWLLVATGAAVAACLLNPHGVRALLFPFIIIGEGDEWRKGVNEWLPSVLFQEQNFNPALFGFYLLAQCVLLALVLVAAPRRVDVASALLAVVTAVMALSARRFIPLFTLVSAPFAAANMAYLADELGRRQWAPALGRVGRETAVVVFGLAALVHVFARSTPDLRRYQQTGLFAGLTDAGYFPAGAAEFLDRNTISGRLLNFYEWGGYLMFWAPERPVFIDGRAHLVYPGEFWIAYKRLALGITDPAGLLDEWQVSLILWPSYRNAEGPYRRVLETLAQSPQWRRVYDDGHATVMAHVERGLPWVEAFQRFGLHYPDNRGALFFQADAHLAANDFEPARTLMREGLRRTPGRRRGPTAAEEQLLAEARSTNAPLLWFKLAFFRDVRDDAGAASAYDAALEHGLADPHAAYARAALVRLSGKTRRAQ